MYKFVIQLDCYQNKFLTLKVLAFDIFVMPCYFGEDFDPIIVSLQVCIKQLDFYLYLSFIDLKRILKVSQKIVPRYDGFMTLLCNYQYDTGNFL